MMYLYIYQLKKKIEWIKLRYDLFYSYKGITFKEELQKKIKENNNIKYCNYDIFL